MAKHSVSGLSRFVRSLGDVPVWIGVDVHKVKYHAALVTAFGLSKTWSCSASPSGFVRQLMGLGIKISMVTYEAGPTGFGLARALEKAGLPVTMVAPSRIPRPSSGGAKSDRLDCLNLANLSMAGLAEPIAIPTETEEAERSLVRRRQQIADQIRRVKQRIKSYLLVLGIDEPVGLDRWTQKSIASLNRLELPSCAAMTLGSLLRELSFHTEEHKAVKKDLKEMLESSKRRTDIDNLRTVPGVGPITGQAYGLEIFRPSRFSHAKELASYLGLAPTTRHSGSGQARSYLRPTGQKRLRSLLIEAAWMWKSKDVYAAEIYGRLLTRHGVPQKAITALARKLAIIMWRICVENRPYRPGKTVA